VAAVQIGVGASARIEGTTPVGGIPPTPGSPGGTAAIMPQSNPSVNRAIIVWGIALGVLFLFHVGGAHLG
jgi:hypothetical protein